MIDTILVSIHTPTKGVTWDPSATWVAARGFNPHTHEGCDCRYYAGSSPLRCFNPHTHEGCDKSKFRWFPLRSVSIHTPTKGVTCIGHIYFPNWKVSIHTPTKGVTTEWIESVISCLVSIHTPTKGVTFMGVHLPAFKSVSIHTPTKGVTKYGFLRKVFMLFQSTHPRRVWPNCLNFGFSTI